MNTTSNFRFLGLIVLLLMTGPLAMAQLGKISGTLTDNGTKLPYTRLQLRDGSTIVSQTQTDLEGNYQFAKIEPGQYQIYAKSGEVERTFSIVISPGETQDKDLSLSVSVETNVITDGELFTTDPVQFVTLTRKEIKSMPNTRTSMIDYVGSLPGITQADHGKSANVRGQRPGGTVMFIDGQKVYGDNQVPQAAINQVTLISGGVPAEFGDVTGGIILISTYNPGMKGWSGKPLSREEKKALRKEKKRDDDRSQLSIENKLLASAE